MRAIRTAPSEAAAGLTEYIRAFATYGIRQNLAIAVLSGKAKPLADTQPLGFSKHRVAQRNVQPLEIVNGVTGPIEIPAHAEIAIEGKLILDADEDEGPFGEFTGYASERSTRNAVEVTGILHRKDENNRYAAGGDADIVLMCRDPYRYSAAELRQLEYSQRLVQSTMGLGAPKIQLSRIASPERPASTMLSASRLTISAKAPDRNVEFLASRMGCARQYGQVMIGLNTDESPVSVKRHQARNRKVGVATDPVLGDNGACRDGEVQIAIVRSASSQSSASISFWR